MLTRSTRKLPSDFNENQPIGRKGLLNTYAQRQQILASHPTSPAAFPTLDRPPPKPADERPLWVRGASTSISAGGDPNSHKAGHEGKRRIDMTEDDLLMELAGDDTFLNAPIGCAEAELPLFGQGDYEPTVEPEYNDDFQLDLGQKLLDPLDPGALDLPLFFDEDSSENISQIPAKTLFKDLSNGVKMAIMIEAAQLHKLENVPARLVLTPEDIEDYIKLYNREAADDAARIYNMENDHDWELMHRMAGRTNFEEYHPPQRRLTYRSALSVILRKDVDAGQRYLNMIGQSILVNRLEDYVGCDARGAFVFEQPNAARKGGRVQDDMCLLPSVDANDRHDAISVYSMDEEIVIRDRRRRDGSIAGSVISNSEETVVQNRVRDRTRLALTPAHRARAVPDAVDVGPNLAENDLDATPLLARPPKRRKLMHPRPELLRLPELVYSSTRVVPGPPNVDTPGVGLPPLPSKDRTPPPSVSELVREMSSTKRRAMSRAEDEPPTTHSSSSSPIRPAFATPRGPRVVHLERPGQNPTRHSGGSHHKSASKDDRDNGGTIVRTDLKLRRQLSGVYRPDRQWAEQASSSPLRATTPRPATPRSGSKEYFLSEQHPSHPPSSPRVFDETGRTVREKAQSAEEVQRIFEMQEEAAKMKARKIRLGQLLPDHMLPPQVSSDEAVNDAAKIGQRNTQPDQIIADHTQRAPALQEERERRPKIMLTRINSDDILPPPQTPSGYQRPFSGVKMSNQQSLREVGPAHSTPRRPEPVLPRPSTTPSGYQPPFSSLMRSKQTAAQEMIPSNMASRQTEPILPPMRPISGSYQAPYSSHVGVGMPVSQVGGPTLKSTSTNVQSGERNSHGATFNAAPANAPLPPRTTWETVPQTSFRERGKRPEVLSPVSKARPMKRKVRRSKTQPASAESTEGRLSPVKFDSGDKPLGPPQLKSTYKPQGQPRQDGGKPLYVPPHQRRESDFRGNGAFAQPLPIPSTQQSVNHQGQPNAVKRSLTMPAGASRSANDMPMAGEQPLSQQPTGYGYYNSSFAAHPQATFDGTVKDFSRDPHPQRPKQPNQHTSLKANPLLQGPANLNAPPRAPNVGRQNSMVDNPFRKGQRETSQAPAEYTTAARPPPGGAAQYYSQPPQQPPAKKQKVSQEPQGSPERPLWDSNKREPSVAATKAIPGSFSQTPAASDSSRDLTPTPNMPNNCLSGVLGFPNSENFAKAMRTHGVALPQLTQNAVVQSKKRNATSKIAAPPIVEARMGVFRSPTAPAPRTPANGQQRSPTTAVGRSKTSAGVPGSARKKKEDKDPKQRAISQFFSPPGKPSAGGGMF